MSEKIKNKLVFDTKDEKGKTVKLAVKRPDVEQSKELKKIWNRAFSDALQSGAPVRAKINDIARQQDLWNDVKEAELNKLQKELFSAELKIQKGGSAGLTKKTAKELALRMREIRAEIRDLTASRNELDARCAEAQAQAEEFAHSVPMCTVWAETGDKYFKDYNDFKARDNETAALDAAKYLALLQYNLDPNYESSLVENKFLKQYGFVDDQLRLVNAKGQLVDSKGRLIREDGRFINEKNELVDADGNLVDEEGNYKVEFTPFLEEEEVEK